ncbi:MAG TPA: thioredoxin domain-containing protein [Candidatus Saccharimonadales bacterium]|nr:thioredoxin domain-containing protein [Candidatus Saccharimonadales bacterium]
MSKQFWAVIVVILVVLGGIFAFTGSKSGNSNSGGSKASPTNHIEGQGKSGVKLVEYGDYECPVCGIYYPVVKQVAQQYDQQIYFQFRNFPLTSIHPNAFAGARAAEAASLQGKFWEMHDKLYVNQDPNGHSGWVASSDPLNQYFVDFAGQIGLDINKFKTDYASDQVNNAVNADLSKANSLGLNGTPTFFLDGKQLDNSVFTDSNGPSLAKFQQVLNAEIAKKGGTPPGGSGNTPGQSPAATNNQ